MNQTTRILPYTKQLVLLALYDVLEQEHSEYQKDAQNGDIVANLTVFGNRSEFTVQIRDQLPATEMTVTVTNPRGACPCKGCSARRNISPTEWRSFLKTSLKSTR